MNVGWDGWVVLAATLILFVLAVPSAISRARFPRNGTMRPGERRLLVAALLFSAAWLVPLVRNWPARSAPTAVRVSSNTSGSCAAVAKGMTEAAVKEKVGEPDEARSNEEIRGPGAKTLIYKSWRCAVHLFDGRVDYVE